MFYSTADSFHDGQYSETMFSARSFTVHKRYRQQVAQLYTLTNLRLYEPYEDECTGIFCRSMVELQGQPLDLTEWLQWYAFDVIACITFQRRFGFMEEQKDVKDMIKGVGAMFPYMSSVGQFPALHPWIMGNRTLTRLRKWLHPDSPDPMKEFLQVRLQRTANSPR
jgi:aromatic ring-cleaving dioxygenase